jgi:hypothetical protein
MLDGAGPAEAVAGIEQAVDLCSIHCPLLDLVEVAVVRVARAIRSLRALRRWVAGRWPWPKHSPLDGSVLKSNSRRCPSGTREKSPVPPASAPRRRDTAANFANAGMGREGSRTTSRSCQSYSSDRVTEQAATAEMPLCDGESAP